MLQVAVIPATEWQRITGSLGRRERELQQQREAVELKQERKHLSQNIVKHWENTIEVHVYMYCICEHVVSGSDLQL